MARLTSISNQIRPRVLAADSTPMNTQLLADALGRDTQFQIIESPSNAPAILTLVREEKPEIAVISAKLGEPSMGAFELVRDVRAESPGTRVVVLLDSSERTSVTEAFRAGAQGVFCCTEPFRLLAKCIQCVDDGQVWASSTELQFVLEALAQPSLAGCLNINGGLLSAREADVVRCVAEGLSNREIGQRLKLTVHTVKNYLFRIFDKLGVSSRVEVALYAFRNWNGTHASPAPSSRRVSQSVAASSRALDKAPVTIRKTAT